MQGAERRKCSSKCAAEHVTSTPNANVLILSFSKKAVAEIQQKLSLAIPNYDNQQINVATFHSFAARLSRQHHSAAGFSKPPTIVSSYSNLLPYVEEAWHKAMLHCLASALHMTHSPSSPYGNHSGDNCHCLCTA